MLQLWSFYLELQRKYCKTAPNCKDNTYKGFDTWLKESYQGGKPTMVELQGALEEDNYIIDPQLPPQSPTNATELFSESPQQS